MSEHERAEGEASEPVSREDELRAAFARGLASGRMEQKLDQALANQARLEAQNVQLLEQHNAFEEEVAKLRQRIVTLEAAPPAHHATASGGATSVHDSLRVMAVKQDNLEKKQDEQTSILRSLNGTKVLYAIGIVLAGALAGWVQAHSAPPPAAPIYYGAPPMTAPAPALPRSAPVPAPFQLP